MRQRAMSIDGNRKLFWDVETEPNQRLHMDLVRLAPSAGDE